MSVDDVARRKCDSLGKRIRVLEDFIKSLTIRIAPPSTDPHADPPSLEEQRRELRERLATESQ